MKTGNKVVSKSTTKTPKPSPRQSVWLFRAIKSELTMDGNGRLFLESPKLDLHEITLKESMDKFLIYEECESDGADFNENWRVWLRMFSDALAEPCLDNKKIGLTPAELRSVRLMPESTLRLVVLDLLACVDRIKAM